MIELPDPKSYVCVADWVELTLVCDDDYSTLSKTQVKRAIEASVGSEPEEPLLNGVWIELARRETLYSPCPFRVQDSYVEAVPSVAAAKTVYVACLLLSLYPTSTEAAKLFERLVCCALRTMGEADVLGWPVPKEAGTDDDSEETRLNLAIQAIVEKMHERTGSPVPGRFKDAKVDVIFWRPFSDQRTSQMVLLVQCTARKDWENKNPVPLAQWVQYLHLAHPPQKGFAVPCIVAMNKWQETSLQKGLLIDRPRIANALPNGVDEDDSGLGEDLKDWTESFLDEVTE